MSKTELVIEGAKLLLIVVGDIRKLADSVEALCSLVTDGLQAEEKPALPKAKEKKPSVSLEEVRRVLAEKSQDGYTAEVRAIIAKYGASRLSDIAPEKYEAVLKDAEVLGNAG